MTTDVSQSSITDEEITAFLDGMADSAVTRRVRSAQQDDPAVAARMESLQLAGDILRGALTLDALDAPEMPAHLGAAEVAPPRSFLPAKLLVPAAMAASFVLGAFSMNALQPDPAPKPGWIDQVASYQALYVAETLQGEIHDTGATKRALALASSAMGVNMPDAPEIEGLVFKRAQILALNGKALIQLAYVDAQGVPYALCLTPIAKPNKPVAGAVKNNLAAASWIENGVGYVLIGGTDQARIATQAETLTTSL